MNPSTTSLSLVVRILLPVTLGALISVACHIFLVGLGLLTSFRVLHPELIFALPAGGMLLVWCKMRWGAQHFRTSEYVKNQTQQAYRFLPVGLGITGLLGTWLTHFLGGSAGRESTAVQMGASMSDLLSAKLNLTNEYRIRLMLAGISAAFGCAVGAPWAALLFGLEWTESFKSKRPYFEIGICVVTAYFVSQYLSTPHLKFQHFESLAYNDQSFKAVLLLGLLSALVAFLMRVVSFHIIQFFLKKQISEYKQAFIGGVALIGIFLLFGTQYAGLGLEEIYFVTQNKVGIDATLIKGVATSLTLSTGFMGGEFIPSVFMGTHLASTLSSWILPTNLSLFPLGFVTVFTALFATPLTAVLIVVEIFGFDWWFYALFCCSISHFAMRYLVKKFVSENISRL